jgi:hypothetical protein
MSEELAATEPRTPRVSDTYALVYAFILLFLVPGSIAVGELPFRTYTFQYVALVTVPFVLGLLLTLLTDSHDDPKTVAIRVAVLTPLVVLSGVTVLFLSSLLLVPINQYLGPEYRSVTTPVAALLLAALASPLVIALIRRVGSRIDLRTAIQAVALVGALALVAYVVYISAFQVGRIGELADAARKDVVIYIIGGLVWYGPAFGIAAGVWRRTGIV